MTKLGITGRIAAAAVAAIGTAYAVSGGPAVLAQTQPQGQPAAQQPTGSQPTAPGTYDSRFFSALRWRSIGPNRGGRSQTVAGAASRPLEYYFGATGGGVWKTTDGGQRWKPM